MSNAVCTNRKCGKVKPAGTRTKWCAECLAENNKRYAEKRKAYNAIYNSKPENQERYNDLRSQRRKVIRNKIDNYKKSVGCQHCSESESCCLEFHHLDPEQKEFGIGADGQDKSWQTVLSEISKCVVLCSNCHRKEHERIRAEELKNRENKQ